MSLENRELLTVLNGMVATPVQKFLEKFQALMSNAEIKSTKITKHAPKTERTACGMEESGPLPRVTEEMCEKVPKGTRRIETLILTTVTAGPVIAKTTATVIAPAVAQIIVENAPATTKAVTTKDAERPMKTARIALPALMLLAVNQAIVLI